MAVAVPAAAVEADGHAAAAQLRLLLCDRAGLGFLLGGAPGRVLAAIPEQDSGFPGCWGVGYFSGCEEDSRGVR